MPKLVKVIRILEYIGDEEWMRIQMARNGVKGTYIIGNGAQIREVYCSPAQDISESVPTPKVD